MTLRNGCDLLDTSRDPELKHRVVKSQFCFVCFSLSLRSKRSCEILRSSEGFFLTGKRMIELEKARSERRIVALHRVKVKMVAHEVTIL